MTEIPTSCEDWSINEDSSDSENPGKKFWWNKTYSISIWADQLVFKNLGKSGANGGSGTNPPAAFINGKSKASANAAANGGSTTVPPVTSDKLDTTVLKTITDLDVWRAFLDFQLHTVYKLCSICHGPETDIDMKICCYCGSTVHLECASGAADPDQIAWKPANRGYERYLVVCLACDDKMPSDEDKRKITVHVDNARRAAIRSLALEDELGPELTARLKVVLNYPDLPEEQKMREVQNVNAALFQPLGPDYLDRRRIPSKNNSFGVVALKDIPAFTIVGVYPGYFDPLSGEHAKNGRPGPKYSLVDLNCADYFNRVFPEYDTCRTPFINEPTPAEHSNCAWIGENIHPKHRLSVISVREIKAGEELLLGYGPLYPRDYPYSYSAYAAHAVDDYDNCFAIWYWSSKDEKDAEFKNYIEFDPKTRQYSYWETEEESAARKQQEKEAKQQKQAPQTQQASQQGGAATVAGTKVAEDG